MQDTSEGEGFLQEQKQRWPSRTQSLFEYVRGLVFFQRQQNQREDLIEKPSNHDGGEFDEIALRDPKPRRWKNLQLRTFITSLTGLVLITLSFVFGVGCGLGIGVPYNHGGSGSSPSSHALSHHHHDPNANGGLPDDLPIIPAGQLSNHTELDLATGFTATAGNSAPQVVREFDFTVSMALAAPDGVWKPMVLVNGQSPGPLIEACTGDTVRVRVVNSLPNNASTTMHFHGVDQRGSPWADGVAGVTQCGIPPGEEFVYEFVLGAQRGTFWYHAHAAVQYSDGLYGPIVVRGCGGEGDGDGREMVEMVPATDAERIIFLGENYHAYAGELAGHYLAASSPWEPNEAGVEPLSDNLLLNGQNTFDCSVVSTTFNSTYQHKSTPECTGGKVYTTSIKAGTTMRLRLINHSSYLSYWFSIDSHPLTIVEIDGVEVEPIVSQGVHVNIGQRYSVIISATEKVGDYTIRSSLEKDCFLPYSTYTSSGLESIGYEARGILRYERDEKSEEVEMIQEGVTIQDGREETTTNPWGCGDMPFDVPKPMRQEAAYELGEGDPTHIVDFQFRQVGEINRIFLNKTSWSPYQDDATLWQVADPTEAQIFASTATAGSSTSDGGGVYHNWGFRLDQQVLLIPDGSRAAQVVINSLDAMEHPFHMHGHSVQVVGWGPGRFDPSSFSYFPSSLASSSSPPPVTGTTTTWNLENPLRRDTFTVPAESHVVIRFRADNPGIWVLHCHVAWHLEAGMLVSFLERPADLKSLLDGMDAGTRERSESFCPKRARSERMS
ncbi:multicopper oxidase [Diaporthe helianthi]|uniref:Multicopper oxidase n=1 Tax=Diaporthe helianthi TaxID=158607 RepID=A0A2P5I131_DIAHE|nr:multicopper oxidase [Diaporthe helianthi]